MRGDCAVDTTGWITFRCPRPGCGAETSHPVKDACPPLCKVGHPDEPAEMYRVLEPTA